MKADRELILRLGNLAKSFRRNAKEDRKIAAEERSRFRDASASQWEAGARYAEHAAKQIDQIIKEAKAAL